MKDIVEYIWAGSMFLTSLTFSLTLWLYVDLNLSKDNRKFKQIIDKALEYSEKINGDVYHEILDILCYSYDRNGKILTFEEVDSIIAFDRLKNRKDERVIKRMFKWLLLLSSKYFGHGGEGKW